MSDQFLLDFFLGVFPAETHVNQRVRRAAAGAFRGDRPVSAQTVGSIDDPSAAVQRDGHATAHVADDGRRVFGLAAGVTQELAHDGAGVQGVEKGFAGEFRDATDVAFREHLVGHRRIGDIGYAGAEAGREAFLLPQLVDLMGDVVADQGAEVAGVVAVPAGGEDFPHVGVDVVYAGDAGGEKAAAGHDDVDVFQADALFAEGAQDLVRSHLVLVHDVGELRQLLDGMLEFLVKDGFSVTIDCEFGGDGPGVDDQDDTLGGFAVDGSDDAHNMFFIICYKVGIFFRICKNRPQK